MISFFVICLIKGSAQCNLMCNTDFENNPGTANVSFIQDSLVSCWNTTATDHLIEIWKAGYQNVPAYSGGYFVELNANQVSTLYQNFTATAGTSVTISFAHRGRQGTDVINLSIGPVGGPYVSLGNYSDGNTAWGFYTFVYVIPAGIGNNHSLRFNSVSASGGDASVGNFLDAITVQVSSSSTLNVSSTSVSCFGGTNGTAQAVMNGGVLPYTYTWSPSSVNAASVTGLSAGIYTVSVTEGNGCLSTKTVQVAQNPALAASVSIQDPSCLGAGNGSAKIGASGGLAPYTYTWTAMAAQSASVSNLAPGSYTVQIGDAAGCKASRFFQILPGPALTMSVVTGDASCHGAADGNAVATIVNGTAPYSYTWSPIASSTASVTGLAANDYTVLVASAEGCQGSATFSVGQPAVLSASVSLAGTCRGIATGSMQVTASGGTAPYTYNWAPGAQASSSIIHLNAGTYSCTIRDANNCTHTATAAITVLPPDNLSVTGGEICYGETAALEAHGADTYTWLPGNVSGALHAVKPSATSSYTVITKSARGCIDTLVTRVIVNPKPFAFAGPDTLISADEPLIRTGNGSDTYGWISLSGDPALSCNYCHQLTENPQQSTCYVLEAVNDFSCRERDTLCVTVIQKWDVYIPNAFTPGSDNLNDIFLPVGYGVKTIEMRIYDRWGELVFASNEEHKGWDGTCKGILCKPDVYIYKVEVTVLNNEKEYRVGSVTLLK